MKEKLGNIFFLNNYQKKIMRYIINEIPGVWFMKTFNSGICKRERS